MTEAPIDMAALGHAFESALEVVPVKPLEDFASRRKLLSGGYRRGRSAVLCALVANAERPKLTTYDPELAVLYRTYVPEARLLAMLSREVLEERRRQLTAFFGKERFLLALLMDPREDVRTSATTWMSEGGSELPEPEVARDLLAQAFSPVVAIGDVTSGNTRGREVVAELRKQMVEQEKAARKERRVAETETQEVVRRVKIELATARFGIDERQHEIDRLNAALEKEREARELRVRELMAVRQIEVFQGWLKPCVKAEELAIQDVSAPLLERAEKAIAQQMRLDRASALRGELSGRLAQTEAMLSRIDETLSGAMIRHAGLVTVRAELVAERDRLRETLGTPEPDPLTAALATRIVTATETDYEPLLALLEQGARLGLVGKGEEARLRRAFHRRVSTWSAGMPEIDKDTEAALEAADMASTAIEQRNPGLTKALRGIAPVMIFLDGHNILNGLGRYKQRRGTALTHEDARKRVERDLSLLLRNLPMAFAHLVWDGSQSSVYTISDNIAGHYSGGVGEHRADRYILAQLAFYREKCAVPMVVVTDDNGFAGETLKLGASVCRLHDFEAFLNGPGH